MEPDILSAPLPFWLAGLLIFRAGNKQCHTPSRHANIYCQISSALKAHIFMWSSFLLPGLLQSTPPGPPPVFHIAARINFQARKFKHSVLLKVLQWLLPAWFFLEGQPPFEDFRSTMDSHPMEKIKMYILSEAHPHPQDNTLTPQPVLVLTTGLASTSLTSVCFLYLHALAILNYLQFLLYFLLFPAFMLCSCCSLCLECSPQFYAPDRFYSFVYSAEASSFQQPSQTIPGRHRHSCFPYFVLKSPV